MFLFDDFIKKRMQKATATTIRRKHGKTVIEIRNLCHGCDRWVDHVQACSRCLQAQYCSIECQKQHWKAGHRQACQLQSTSTVRPASNAHDFLERLIRKAGDDTRRTSLGTDTP